jgi:DNA end-binding protein Ku
MAPRANWKGFLRLSLVTCPVALYPATSDSEKISFNQINRTTGHRIKYMKVDADTGEEVSNEDITKGYKVDTDTYIDCPKKNWKTSLWNPAEQSTLTSSFLRAASIRATSSARITWSPTAKSDTTLLR